MGITSFNPMSSSNMWGFRLPRQYNRQGPSPGLAMEEALDTDLSLGGRTLTFGTFENGLFFFKNFPDCVCVTWRTQGLLSRAGVHWVKVNGIGSKTKILSNWWSIVDFLSCSFIEVPELIDRENLNYIKYQSRNTRTFRRKGDKIRLFPKWYYCSRTFITIDQPKNTQVL